MPLTPPRAVGGSENPGGGEASSDVSGHNTVVQPTNRVGTLGYDRLPPLSGACQKAS